MRLNVEVYFEAKNTLSSVLNTGTASSGGASRGRSGALSMTDLPDTGEIRREVSRVRKEVADNFAAGGAIPSNLLRSMMRDLPESNARELARKLIPKGTKEEVESLWRETLSGIATTTPYALGLPLGAARGASRLLQSPGFAAALPWLGAGAIAAGAAIPAYEMYQTSLRERRAGGSYLFNRGAFGGASIGEFSGALTDSQDRPLASASIMDTVMQGLTGLLPRQFQWQRRVQRAQTTSMLSQLSTLGVSASDIGPGLGSLRATSALNNAPVEDLLDPIAGNAATVPRGNRGAYINSAARARYYAERLSNNPGDIFAQGMFNDASTEATGLLGQGRLEVARQQLTITGQIAEDYAGITRNTERAQSLWRTANQETSATLEKQMMVMADPTEIFEARKTAIASLGDIEIAQSQEVVNDRKARQLQAMEDVKRRESELLSATGRGTLAEAMGAPEDALTQRAKENYRESLRTQIDRTREVADAESDLANVTKSVTSRVGTQTGVAKLQSSVLDVVNKTGEFITGVELAVHGAGMALAGATARARLIGANTFAGAQERAGVVLGATRAEARGFTAQGQALIDASRKLRRLPGETEEGFALRQLGMQQQGEALQIQGAIARESAINQSLESSFIAGRPRREQIAERRELRLRGRQVRRGAIRDVLAGGELDEDAFTIDRDAIRRAGGGDVNDLIRRNRISASDIGLRRRGRPDGETDLTSVVNNRAIASASSLADAFDRLQKKIDAMNLGPRNATPNVQRTGPLPN